jgi:NAD(P)H-hydrate epimerase
MVRLTRAQAREVDRLAQERYQMPTILLMENAARAVANVACEMLGGDCSAPVVILCGGGNNGGDGLAVARHLHNRGAAVTVALTVDPAKYQRDALANWRIVQAMGLATVEADPHRLEHSHALLVVDAVFGTGLSGPPREGFGAIVEAVRSRGVAVLAVDLPSGMDCDTGLPLGACVPATRTVSFVAEKAGFAEPGARALTGYVTVADIGCPREILEQVVGASHQ